MSSHHHNISFPSTYPSFQVPEVSLPEFVFSNPSMSPNKVILVDGMDGRFYTQKLLREHVNKVAHGLDSLGYHKGNVLLMLTPNIIEYPVMVHGALLLGGVVSTCNPAYTSDEISHQLKDSGATYVFTTNDLVSKVKEASKGLRVKYIIVVGPTGADDVIHFYSLLDNPGTPPKVKINAKEDVAILPYSSGTTGLPKGVMLTHYNLVSNCLQVQNVEPLGEEVLVTVLPFFHIYAFTVIMSLGLYVGAKNVILPKFELPVYLACIQKHRATYLFIVPPIAIALAKHPLVDKYDLSSVKTACSGAAPLSAETEKEIIARLKLNVKQAYGMTESSPAISIRDSTGPHGSCGRLLPLHTARLISITTGKPVGVDEEGELIVIGPNIMKGYLNNDKETQKTIDKEGFLHTGDVAKVDKDGYFYITDRVKELIKVKGFQVAPAELEALLLTHPAVADAAVIPINDEKAGELPKAFVVLKDKQKPIAIDEIDQFVNRHVVSYKRFHGRIEFVDAIPKSASGKILRRMLKLQEAEKQKAKL
eukprot:TRINITY_DN8110_c0_g2_i1.p1 TRINITY_DN8110_c0_g2~~TRINITY_DN8110_c0_g2_i1.p1  ORF type:complete len:552 (-),score=193.69 TRINITY_DN8110_c0_g2_i1:75-1676(-)